MENTQSGSNKEDRFYKVVGVLIIILVIILAALCAYLYGQVEAYKSLVGQV